MAGTPLRSTRVFGHLTSASACFHNTQLIISADPAPLPSLKRLPFFQAHTITVDIAPPSPHHQTHHQPEPLLLHRHRHPLPPDPNLTPQTMIEPICMIGTTITAVLLASMWERRHKYWSAHKSPYNTRRNKLRRLVHLPEKPLVRRRALDLDNPPCMEQNCSCKHKKQRKVRMNTRPVVPGGPNLGFESGVGGDGSPRSRRTARSSPPGHNIIVTQAPNGDIESAETEHWYP